ncbi:MAG: glycosyltransferase [Planctomycetota bacterium]
MLLGQQIQKVEISICTWNRAQLLEPALRSVSRLFVPDPIQLSVIVVDNGSTDKTSDVLSDFQKDPFFQQHPLRIIRESRQGHCFARNAAIDAAEGDLLIWTDDDVEVSSNWIQEYVQSAEQRPEFSFWGGPILPEFTAGKPVWIREQWSKIKGCFAARDLGPEPVEFHSKRLPYGANFAVRTDIQKQFRFDEELGRKGSHVLGEDEIDLLARLLADGLKGRWVPEAKLKHIIPPERATEKYVYDYFVGQGQRLARLNPIGNPRQLAKEARWNYYCYLVKRPFLKSDVWIGHMLHSALCKGKSESVE